MGDSNVDLVAQVLLLWGVAAAAMSLALGGFVRPVGGAWLDGERRILLRQYGCLVRGEGYVEGGKQVYRGLAAFGFVRLSRYDYGALHLGSLGFSHQQWPALHGRVMAHFVLRRSNGALEGTFTGRRFRFAGAELHETFLAPPQPRRWLWAGASDSAEV